MHSPRLYFNNIWPIVCVMVKDYLRRYEKRSAPKISAAKTCSMDSLHSLLLQEERRCGEACNRRRSGGTSLEMRQSPGAESTDKAFHEHVDIAKVLANRAYQNLVRTVDKISSDFNAEGWRPPSVAN